jgi:hypothetical protein
LRLEVARERVPLEHFLHQPGLRAAQGGEGCAHGGDHCGIGQLSVVGEADEGAAPSAERFET